MWTNQDGQVITLPRHRRHQILRRFVTPDFRDLVKDLYRGNWRNAIERGIGHVITYSRRAGAIRHSDGTPLPIFETNLGDSTYQFVTLPRGSTFSILSVKTREASEADRFDSRVTGQNLAALDQYLRSTLQQADARKNWRQIILDNQGQSTIDGRKIGSTVDRAYVTNTNGTPTRVNVELDGNWKDFNDHITERVKRDRKAHHYFLLQDNRTGELKGAMHWDPRANNGRGGMRQVHPRNFTGQGAARFKFLPVAVKPAKLSRDPGYRKVKDRSPGVTRSNFGQKVQQQLKKNPRTRNLTRGMALSGAPTGRRARESGAMFEYMSEALPELELMETSSW